MLGKSVAFLCIHVNKQYGWIRFGNLYKFQDLYIFLDFLIKMIELVAGLLGVDVFI